MFVWERAYRESDAGAHRQGRTVAHRRSRAEGLMTSQKVSQNLLDEGVPTHDMRTSGESDRRKVTSVMHPLYSFVDLEIAKLRRSLGTSSFPQPVHPPRLNLLRKSSIIECCHLHKRNKLPINCCDDKGQRTDRGSDDGREESEDSWHPPHRVS
jgi:hypothetical protein